MRPLFNQSVFHDLARALTSLTDACWDLQLIAEGQFADEFRWMKIHDAVMSSARDLRFATAHIIGEGEKYGE